MSKITCNRLTIALCVIGSQIPGFVLWSVSSKATNEGPCTYRWGDVNQAVERAAYQAQLRLQYGDAYPANEQSSDLPPAGTTERVSGSFVTPQAPIAFEGDSSTQAPIYQDDNLAAERAAILQDAQAAIAAEQSRQGEQY